MLSDPQPVPNRSAMPIPLDGDPPDVNSRRRANLVPERALEIGC
jgi:hypothetical protein